MTRARSEAAAGEALPVVDVLGVPVARVTTAEFCEWLLRRLQARRRAPEETRAPFITYLNAACSNIAAKDGEYRRILHGADCVYADGQAVVWAAGVTADGLPERVNAGDFIVDFCEELARAGLTLGLVGGRPGVAARAAAAWLEAVPTLKVAGAWNGFFEDDGTRVCEAVNASDVDLLLVGMGVPLQEKWAWERRERLNVGAVWCVGALFEYYGEGRARAPVWMRRVGLEWAFRLALEPRRLWRRYLVGNAVFVRRVNRARKGRD